MVVYPQIIYLDKQLTKSIRKIQKRIFKLTGSRACLDIWNPHLTIGNSIDIGKDEEENFYHLIETVTKNFKPFYIEIKNYNFMDNWPGGNLKGYTPFVIYLDVIVNPELQKLASSINENVSAKFKSWYKQPWPYTPHVTVAFKDLDEAGFLKVKEILKDEKFSETTLIDHVAIAKEDKEGKWKECKRFNFLTKV
jgi:2'-5' RNA ligase